MKNLYFKLLIISLFLVSCEDFLDEGDSPNGPKTIAQDRMFTGIVAGLIAIEEGEASRTTAIWMQQATGTSRQYSALQNYSITAGELNPTWTTAYKTLRNIKLYKEGIKLNDKFQTAVAKFSESLLIGKLASLFGDVPYSQAGDYNKFPTPKFDDQLEIYTKIQDELDMAISLLISMTSADKKLSNDWIYDGEASKWIEACYTLKARYYLHWKNYSAARTAALNGISLGNDFSFKHGANAKDNNLIHDFQSARDDYMRSSETLVDLMKSRQDSVLLSNNFTLVSDSLTLVNNGFPFPGSPQFIGGKLGASNSKISNFGDAFAQGASFTALSYVENQMILAECEYRIGTRGSAENYINNVRTADQKPAITEASFPGADLLREIINEKYVHMLFNPEVWQDWKRTGYPELRSWSTYNPNTDMPRRHLYPQSARDTNPNTPANPARNDNDN